MRGNHARTIFMAALALSQGGALAAGTGPNLPTEIVEQLMAKDPVRMSQPTRTRMRGPLASAICCPTDR